MSIQKILKVGIAGYGVVGKRRRQAIDRHPALQTVAVCDNKFNVAEEDNDGISCYSDYKQLLREELDILFVCLPNYLAAEVTIAGLQHGLHVFCEKPPGRNLADIKQVVAMEKRHPHLLLKYGFNHRYHDSVLKALQIHESRELGEIINMRGVYGKSKIIPFSGGWRAMRKYSGGGILLDQGIHMIDLMLLFCGDFIDVKSYISNKFWNHDVEDNTYAIMRTEDGRVAMLHSSATEWHHRFNLDITFSKGYLKLHGILSGSKSYGLEKLVVGRTCGGDVGTQQEETITFLEDHSWGDEINEFADAIVSGSRIKYGNSSEAYAAMKLVYRIYHADPDWRATYHIEAPN